MMASREGWREEGRRKLRLQDAWDKRTAQCARVLGQGCPGCKEMELKQGVTTPPHTNTHTHQVTLHTCLLEHSAERSSRIDEDQSVPACYQGRRREESSPIALPN